MPRYTDQDYQKLARAITQDFVNDEASLSDGFQKVARDGKMNVHEASRLLQTTNVTAHLDLFEKMGSERYVEFEALEPADELPRLFDAEKTAQVASPEPWGLGLDLPDEHEAARRPLVEKVAAEMVPVVDEPAPRGKYEGVRGYNAARLVEKTAEELETRLRMAHMNYEDAIVKLATAFRRVDAMDYGQFEKDAVALHGPRVEPVLAKLRDHVRREHGPLDKTASHFVIVRREHAQLRDVVAAYDAAREHANAYQVLAEKVG